jgi:hypothetical protein
LYWRNILRLEGYNTSVAVSKPSDAIFLRILLLCMRRTRYKTNGARTTAATSAMITIFIFARFIG